MHLTPHEIRASAGGALTSRDLARALGREATPDGAACHPADVSATERFFSISLFHSVSNSIIYPEKQDSTNPWSGKAENDKRLKYNRICRARAPFGGRHAPRANAEKPCFLLSEQGSLSPKTGKISPNNWGLTSRNRDINRPCPGRPHGPRPPTVKAAPGPMRHTLSGVARTIAVRPTPDASGSKLNRARPVSSRSGSSPFHGAGRLGANSGHSPTAWGTGGIDSIKYARTA